MPKAKGISEAAFLSAVKRLAKGFGWRVYHTRFSVGSEPGFPDLVLVRPARGGRDRGRIVFAELKSEGGTLSQDQKGWLSALWRCRGSNVEVYCWKPSEMEIIAQLLAPEGVKATLF